MKRSDVDRAPVPHDGQGTWPPDESLGRGTPRAGKAACSRWSATGGWSRGRGPGAGRWGRRCGRWFGRLAGLLVLATLPAAMPAAAADAAGGADPLRVIFDTDMDSDNDDVAAAAMLHALADAGEVEILAMGVVSCCPHSPACLDAINTYYGRGDIPIGVYKGKKLGTQSRYAKTVAQRCPNDVGLAEDVPDVVDVYRRVLAGQPDGAVTMIAVGQMNNLVDLLGSPADAHSELSGRELVRRKVGMLFVMAPYFNERNAYQRAYNFSTSPAAAAEFVEKWPTPVKYGEGNLGHRHFIGSRLAETPEENPARIAFEAYFDGKLKDRHCADPTTVLYAVHGTRYFDEVGPGACDVRAADGFTRWDASTDKQHYYNKQKLSIDALEKVMEDLLVRPPKARTADGSGAARPQRKPNLVVILADDKY